MREDDAHALDGVALAAGGSQDVKPRWRKLSAIEYVMVLPHNWHLRVVFANNRFWMWQLLAGPIHRSGSVIHGTAPVTIDDPSYATPLECKQAAVLYARRYFREMLESV